ncbi:MAG: HD domain-containing protein [Lachnospiraceae bacterium]|nr:HD domain-containing protein [Lachnospiraceae bacterium]
MSVLNTELKKKDLNRIYVITAVILGTAVNVGLSYAAFRLDLPMYLDTIGTITVAVLGGLFPGIFTGVATSVLCGLFNPYSIYYTLISVLISVATSWFVSRNRLNKAPGFAMYVCVLAFLGGVLGTLFQWLLLGGPQFKAVAEASSTIKAVTGMAPILSAMIVNFGLNVVDKGIAAAVAMFVTRIVPEEIKTGMWNNSWKQVPFSKEELKGLLKKSKSKPKSIQRRMSFLILFAAASLTAIMCWISISLYYEDTKKEYTQNAQSAARFAAGVVDADRIGEFMRKGDEAAGYMETRNLLYRIRDNSPGVKYLYVIKVEKDACYVVFDLDTVDTPAIEPGGKIEFEEAFLPYLPTLFEGKEIPPIESNDVSGWVLTAYYPVKNSEGITVCYAAADVSMDFLSAFVRGFITKTILIFSGFFILVLGYGLWVTRYYLYYPIGSMTAYADDFIKESDEQKEMDKKVRAIKALGIRTDDEVEALYQALCRMASGMSDQMRAVRYYAETTSQMQNGLIITMADMVENRDSDTGAHVHKTSAYVRIILEGLKAKGYYESKLTPKYMSDVEMSAPLHDVGKINIPDAILNKPGKLTDEEYEIMKTHTTAGKKILENAISTLQGENYLKEARNMAAYHHERWDGKGYPEGLKGEVIPLSARVMAIADVFDALSSPRVYKPPFPLEKALEMIREGAGSQFDPKCVEVFMDNLSEVKVVLKKYNET